MLSEIRLDNFKRFKSNTVVPCSRLTLLTGVNSKGKSTALQPVLLIHQSLLASPSEALSLTRLPLNGPSVQIGSYRDLQHRDRRTDPVVLGFEFTQAESSVSLQLRLEDEPSQRSLRITRAQVETWHPGKEPATGSLDESADRRISLLLDEDLPGDPLGLARAGLRSLRSVHHVGADRMGPQEFYPRSDNGGFVNVGVRGERCAEALSWATHNQLRVAEALVAPLAKDEAWTVVDQATAWMSYVFGGAMVKVDEPYATILTLEFNADKSAHYFRPVNVGFGFSYVLPIIVAGLIARPGESLVVENPEAHLHPMAQARLGEFLALVASTGVQVFVESHSEHMLNAFRLAIRSNTLTSSDLCVLYFDDGPAPLLKIEVDGEGKVGYWPDGFFDQRLQDFAKLFER